MAYSTTEQPLDPTEATRAVPYSRNYNYCDCCRCPASVLTVYKPPTDCCRCDTTLQIDREWGLTSSHDTRTDANLRDNYLSMSGSDPSHREVGRPSHALHAHQPPPAHPPARSVDIVSMALSCTTQRSAVVADPLWVIPDTRRSRGLTPVACRPADQASRPVVLHAKQQKSLPAGIYFDWDKP